MTSPPERSPTSRDDPVAHATADSNARPRQSPARRHWRRFSQHRLAVAGLVFLGLLAVIGLLAPLVARREPWALASSPFQTPNADYWMGTDSLGRDVWSRIVHGARISLQVAFGSQVIVVTVGLLVGAIAGFFGKWVDKILMRTTDIFLALPPLLTALLFLSAFGNSIPVLIAAIGFATWPLMARLVRGQVVALKEREFVEAADALGSPPFKTLRVHVVPNIMGIVFVQMTFGMSQAIFAEAFLSFIGLGPSPPTPSWGRLINEGFANISIASHLVVFPAIAVALTVLALSFVGDGLRDAVDPRDGR